MTADQVKGKGFKGALGYNLDKVENGVAHILTSTFNKDDDLKAMLREVALVRMQRPNLARYFYHTSLNFPVNEDLPDAQMKVIADDYLKAMGFGDNQHIIFRHFDADHPHLHILVNRIGYDGSVVSDSRDYHRSEAVLRVLEKKHGLTAVINSREARERAMTKNELEMMKRTDEPSAKMKMQVMIKQALQQNPDIRSFISQLKKEGIDILFNQASTGFVSGISYAYEGMRFKGAQLGNAYKWQSIKTATGYEQESDRTAIHEANVSTRYLIAERTALAGTTGSSAGERAAPDRRGESRGHAQNDRGLSQKRDGQLQEQIRQGGGQDTGQAQPDRDRGGQPRLSDQTGRQQRRAGQEGTEQGGQQVADQVVRDSGLIGDLLGTGHPDRGMADEPLSTTHKRKRKRKRGLSH